MRLPVTLAVGPSTGGSFVCMEVLSFLVGRPWDAVAASWVSTLQPSSIRHSPDGSVKLDSIVGRVTVFTTGAAAPYVIERIERECEVDLFGSIAHGDELEQLTQRAAPNAVRGRLGFFWEWP